MNRGRSSDSLDNVDDDIICSSSGSSSPTDFTSDDEKSANNLFLMSGQPSAKSRNRHLANQTQAAKIDKFRQSPLAGYEFRDAFRTNDRSIRLRLSSIDNHSDHSLSGASTSYHNDSALSTGRLGSLSSRRPDVVPNSSSARLPDQPFGQRRNYQFEGHRSTVRDQRFRRAQNLRAGHSSNALDNENGENVGSSGEEDNDVELDVIGSFGRDVSQLDPSIASIAGPSRGMNTLAVIMCSRLVECRSLIDVVEFIERNREIIDNLTSIVTRQAPAYRNYNMSNYQIDYSVKDSFNPNFWLDREPIVTTADGNCQYHAVSLSLTGSEEYTPEVRLATAVAVIDNQDYFDSILKLIDRGTVLDLVHTIARSYSWGDETTLKAVAVAINRRIFLYTCNIGKKDYEMVKSLSKEELLDAFNEKKYRGGTGIHTYADPLIHVPANNYIMLFHKSEHFIAVLPTGQQLTMFEPYNPIVPVFT